MRTTICRLQMYGAVQLQLHTAGVAHARATTTPGCFAAPVNWGVRFIAARSAGHATSRAAVPLLHTLVVVRKPSTVVCTFMMTHVWDIIRARFTCSAKLAHVRGSILDWAHCAVTT